MMTNSDLQFINKGKFQAYLHGLLFSDICQFVYAGGGAPEDLALAEKCPLILDKVLQSGLTLTLKRLSSEFQTEYDLTGFNHTKRVPNVATAQQKEQQYASYFVKLALDKITNFLSDALKEEIYDNIRNTGILLYVYFGIMVLALVALLVYTEKLTYDFRVVKHFIYAVPFPCLIEVQQLATKFRHICKKYRLTQ